MPIQQKNRVMGVKTPLDDDLLLLQSVNAKELMSGLFEYTLDLVSEAPDIDFNELVGEQMTVRFEMAGGETRFFNGYVSRFSQAGFEDTLSKYQATLVPWLWFLTRTSDCRIFQNMKIPDVIKNVFRENGFSDFEDLLTEEYREWENCVQYAETDFNFVSRLMEQEGISYYFTQEADKHTLVLSDSYNAHQSKEGYEIVPFFPPDSTAIRERDHISAWSTSRQVQPGVYVHNDFDFKKPKKVLESKTSTPRKHAASDYEIFSYPGEYTEKADGENYSKVRLQELQARFETFEGSGNVQGLSAGCLFELENLPREDQNGEYLVTSIHYKLESDRFGSGETAGGATFQCQFSSISSKESFRPGKQTPKPKVQGLQTAIVVGKAGEEIWTDEFGRVKVQFHWDRYGNSDENSSCWVRVAQVWAGKKWGGIQIPRIGQEVLIEFLEGDPDRPIITGRVYNGDLMPPYPLPANATQSGIKSQSSKGGSPDNFNEIRFEDKKGAEEVFLQAEKDWTINVKNDKSQKVGHDETLTAGNDRTKTVGNDETNSVGNNRTSSVGNDETVSIGNNRTKSVGTNESVSIGENRSESVGSNESISIGSNRDESVGKNESISIGENRTKDVGKNETINVGKNRETSIGKDETVQIGEKRAVQVGKDDALKVGKKLAIEAGDEIILKTGSASITLKKNGDITLKGKKITIKGSGDVVIKGSKITQN